MVAIGCDACTDVAELLSDWTCVCVCVCVSE